MSGDSFERVIVYADPADFMLAGRVAKRVFAPGYEWAADGIAIVAFQHPGQEPWQAEHFSVRRNKTGITIWGPRHNAAPVVAA